jgi:hypothetical protein
MKLFNFIFALFNSSAADVKLEWKGWAQFGESFKYMGLGMLGVFLVTAIIILCISALNRVGKGRK